jgi:hypothetical protein
VMSDEHFSFFSFFVNNAALTSCWQVLRRSDLVLIKRIVVTVSSGLAKNNNFEK